MRIGIISRGLTPGDHVIDRWRFNVIIKHAVSHGHRAEYLMPGHEYDVVIAPLLLENERQIRYILSTQKCRVIADISDDHLSCPWHRFNLLGKIHQWTYRMLSQKNRRLIAMARLCDALVVQSSLQLEHFNRFNSRSVAITDAIFKMQLKKRSEDSTQTNRIKLVWIGNVESLYGLSTIQVSLDKLNAIGNYELILITSVSKKFPFTWKMPRSVIQFVAKQKIRCRVLPWSIDTVGMELSQGDIAIVPVDEGTDGFTQSKSAGRVLLMMSAGLPVVGTPIRSYKEVIQHGHTGFLANTPDEWVSAISELAFSSELRSRVGENGKKYALQNFGEKSFADNYFQVINSLALAGNFSYSTATS